MYPKKFEQLIESYRKLPGVGLKTAERYAYETIEWNEEKLNDFIQSLIEIRDGIQMCSICGNLLFRKAIRQSMNTLINMELIYGKVWLNLELMNVR